MNERVGQELLINPAASGAWILTRRTSDGKFEYLGRFESKEEAEDAAALHKL